MLCFPLTKSSVDTQTFVMIYSAVDRLHICEQKMINVAYGQIYPGLGCTILNCVTIFITFLRPSVESEKVSEFLFQRGKKSVLVNKMAPYQMLINL